MNVAVIGTGYVGLVSGTCLAEKGHHVTCVDIDPGKIQKLENGVSPIYEQGLEELIEKNTKAGRLFFTTKYADAVPEADIVMIGVGTPPNPDGSANTRYVQEAAREIANNMGGYAVIANKSTVPVGTRDLVDGIISETYDGDFDVVSNPEMLREGCAVQDFLEPARIIVGTDSEKAKQKMLELYDSFDCPKLVMHPRSAELTKYAANSFLATKISFINEVAHLAEEVGADIEEVAEGIGTDPRIGKQFLRAGLGWGGSCFPKDVRAMLHMGEKASQRMPIIEAAFEVNDKARKRVVERMEHALEDLKGKRVAIFGLAFKNNTDDTRESAAISLAEHFLGAGAHVSAYDPKAEIFDEGLKERIDRTDNPYSAGKEADIVVIATEWDEFRTLDLAKLKEVMRGDILMDARNLLHHHEAISHGFRYFRVGK